MIKSNRSTITLKIFNIYFENLISYIKAKMKKKSLGTKNKIVILSNLK